MDFETLDYSNARLQTDWRAHFPFAPDAYIAKCEEHLAGVLVPQNAIEQGLWNASKVVGEHFRGQGIEKVLMLEVPNGAYMTANFVAPLLSPYVEVARDKVKVSRYGLDMQPVDPYIKTQPKSVLQGTPILVVEDLIDEGFSMECILDYLVQQNVASITVLTLAGKNNLKVDLDRPRIRPETDDEVVPIERVTVCKVANHWLGGYGMDIVVKEDGDRVKAYRDAPVIVAANPDYLEREGIETRPHVIASLQELVRQAA